MRCYGCGREFACGMETPVAGDACWCEEYPPLGEINPEQSCLCTECLKAALAREGRQIDPATQCSATPLPQPKE